MNADQAPPPGRPLAQIGLLGTPRLEAGGRSEPLRPGRKPLALLAWLAAHPGEEQSREKLAALLWPDRFEEQARASLRQALSALRKALGPHGEAIRATGDGHVSLDPGLLASDLALFDRLCASDEERGLEAAASLYEGDFLDQLGAVSEEFDAWAAGERERRRAQAAGALTRLVDMLRAAGRLEEARARAERLVAIDPAHEPGHRALMAILAASGQRAAALRCYEACRQALARLLDAEPDAETAALADAIRSGDAAGDPGRSEEPRREPPPAAPQPGARAFPSSLAPRGTSGWRLRPSLLRALRRRRLVIGAAAAAVAAAALWIARPPPREPAAAQAASPPTESHAACLAPAGAAAKEPALVVLPLADFAGASGDGLFAAAATERVQSVLSLIPGVAVIAGPPAGHPDLALGPQEIARRTGATHVLDGAVRARAGRLEVTARLLEAKSGRQLWQSTERLPLPLADPVGAQDAIALAAVQAVQERLTDGRQALANRRYEPETLPVWEANTRGWAGLAALDPLSNARARASFEAALAMEPRNAGASAGIALSYVTPVVLGWTTDVQASLDAARPLADAAREIDPDAPTAASIRAMVALLDGDHARAVELGEEALRLSGDGADAAAFLAYILSYTNDTARAVELARRAARARPYASPLWYALIYAHAARLDGDVDAALGCLDGVLAERPGAVVPALEAIQALDAKGGSEGARAAALVRVVREQAPEGFTAAAYCATPRYTDETRTEACVGALRRAGLP